MLNNAGQKLCGKAPGRCISSLRTAQPCRHRRRSYATQYASKPIAEFIEDAAGPSHTSPPALKVNAHVGLVSEAALTRAQSQRERVVRTLRHSSPTALERMRELVGANSKIRSEEKQGGGSPTSKKPRKNESPKRPSKSPQAPKPPPPNLERPDASTSQWKGEQWSNDWGTDTLKPPPDSQTLTKSIERQRPPHASPPQKKGPRVAYVRRVEGLLEQKAGSVLQNLNPPSEHRPIATLSHGLERVLFNPGVHWLQDPRSRVYNFTHWLESLPQVQDFAFERLPAFIKSSRDEDLWSLAKAEGRRFGGSTSSLSGMLSQIYFLISGDRDVDISTLSHNFANEKKDFTPGQRMPASVQFNYKDGVYAIDSDSDTPGASEKNVLTWLGTLLEKFLTTPPDEFKRLMRTYTPETPPSEEEEANAKIREAYRYSKSNSFVMRSQLDCVDRRLPGTGVFDIKTRAALPIRLDLMNYQENSGYLIRTQYGPLESFEREYYDLIRSAFLKYSFQVRIGNMDGVFVAYHNTARMFGFQYISLEEMDERLFGGSASGERVFRKCVEILEIVSDEITRCFPEQSVKCTFETVKGGKMMDVFVEPTEWDENPDMQRPIKLLEVTSESYLGEDQVRGARAVTDGETPWCIHWTVSQTNVTEAFIREKLAGTKARQFRAYNIPSGVEHADLAEYWDGLNYGGQASPIPAAFLPEKFRVATGNILALRELARAGKLETDSRAAREAGKRKVVLGEPIVEEDETFVEVAQGVEEVVNEGSENGSSLLSPDAEDAGEATTSVPVEDAEKGSDSVYETLDIDVDPTSIDMDMEGSASSPPEAEDPMHILANEDAGADNAAYTPSSTSSVSISPDEPVPFNSFFEDDYLENDEDLLDDGYIMIGESFKSTDQGRPVFPLNSTEATLTVVALRPDFEADIVHTSKSSAPSDETVSEHVDFTSLESPEAQTHDAGTSYAPWSTETSTTSDLVETSAAEADTAAEDVVSKEAEVYQESPSETSGVDNTAAVKLSDSQSDSDAHADSDKSTYR